MPRIANIGGGGTPIGDGQPTCAVAETDINHNGDLGFDAPVGCSGHEVELATTCAAAVPGACSVERHITFDRAVWGNGQAASVEQPWDFMRLAHDIRVIKPTLGDSIKRVYKGELPAMRRLRWV